MRFFGVACFAFALLIGLSLVAPEAAAQAPVPFITKGLSKSFCKEKTFRQTVIYVDDTSISHADISRVDSGQTDIRWVGNLDEKLRATLTPGERVTVIELSPRQGTSHELWSGCWPNFSAGKKVQFSREHFWFSRNPLDSLKQQQGMFLNAIGGSLRRIFTEAKKLEGEASEASGTPPKKEIVDALADDGARYSQTDQTIRALVYTDGAENSTIGSVFSHGAPEPTGVGKALGTYFHHSVFYFFGIRPDVTDDPTYLADSHRFWTAILASMGSTIEGFGSDLSVANEVPIAAHRYHVALVRDGQSLQGVASLLTDASGNLIDSWIGIDRLTFVALTGTFKCNSGGPHACTLNATTNGGLATSSNTETLTLTGGSPKELKGTVGVPGTLTFPVSAELSRHAG